jgi:hypothetical protein
MCLNCFDPDDGIADFMLDRSIILAAKDEDYIRMIVNHITRTRDPRIQIIKCAFTVL